MFSLIRKKVRASANISNIRRSYHSVGEAAGVQKGTQFAHVSDKDLQVFESIIGAKSVLTDESELETFNTDWQSRWIGRSKVALLPQSTEQVSELLKYCNERKLAVVPQAGNTGQVGGSVPVFDEVILSVKKMNKILEFDDVNGILSA